MSSKGPIDRLVRRLTRLSQFVHLWMGLLLAVYLGWTGASGIFLNHPELISGLSVPEWLVPHQYRFEDWNRGTLRQLVPAGGESGVLLAAGRLGVWRSDDGGRSFTEFNQGLGSLYERNTAHLMRLEVGGESPLLAATRGGLFSRDPNGGSWTEVPLGDGRPVVKLLRTQSQVVAFSDSGAFVAAADRWPLRFAEVDLGRSVKEHRVDLTEVFFGLHSGEAWGLAGRLLYDLVGLVLVFLSVTAVVTWLYKKVRGRFPDMRRAMRPVVRGLVRYHLDLGVWSALILLLIGATGIFMRPPLLALLVDRALPRQAYPGLVSSNPWHHRIQNATWERGKGRILIQADDGIWQGPDDFSRVFEQTTLPVPVFAMGATVFEARPDGSLDVGSFGGLFRIAPDGSTEDLIEGGPVVVRSSGRPGDLLVTGYLQLPDGTEALTSHYKGLLTRRGEPAPNLLGMPAVNRENTGMPLWNFMFELHNGRIFRGLIGDLYILIVPLGGLFMVLLTITGVWDWAVPRLRRRRSGG